MYGGVGIGAVGLDADAVFLDVDDELVEERAQQITAYVGRRVR